MNVLLWITYGWLFILFCWIGWMHRWCDASYREKVRLSWSMIASLYIGMTLYIWSLDLLYSMVVSTGIVMGASFVFRGTDAESFLHTYLQSIMGGMMGGMLGVMIPPAQWEPMVKIMTMLTFCSGLLLIYQYPLKSIYVRYIQHPAIVFLLLLITGILTQWITFPIPAHSPHL